MTRLPRAAALALLAVLCATPVFLALTSRMLSLTLSDSVYAVGDEVHTVSADASVLKDGYWGFRCLASNMSRCYGGAQTWQDMATMAPLPRNWLLGLKTHQDLQVRWPWLTEYPRMLKVLRVQRMLFVYAVPLLFLFLMRGVAWPWRATMAAAVVSSSPFHGSWEGNYLGIKSEFTGIFWGLIHLLLCLAALRRSRTPSFNALWLLAALSGVWALCTRPSNISFIGLSHVFYFGYRAFIYRLPRRAVAELSASTALGALFYLALNPNTFVSTLEAKWLPFYIAMGLYAQPASTGWPRIETLLFSLRDVLIGGTAFWLAIRHFGWREAGRRYGLPMAAALSLVPSCYRFSGVPYYMPVCMASLLVAALVICDTRTLKTRWLAAICALVAGTGPLYFVSSRSDQIQLSWPEPSHRGPLEDEFLALKPSTSPTVAVDRPLRPAIREEAAGAVQFFDSLSDSPEDLATTLAPWVTHVYASCWAGDPDPALVSPAAARWHRVIAPYCRHFDPLTPEKTKQFTQALQVSAAYAKIPVEAFRVAVAKAPPAHPHAPPGTIYTRTLRGAAVLPDFWNETLYTLSPVTELSGRFLFKDGLDTLSLPLMNDCKEPTLVTLQVASGGRVQATQTIDADATPALNRDRPFLFRHFPTLARSYLGSRAIIDPPLQVRPRLQPGSLATVRITVKRASSEPCWVVFGNGNMTYTTP